MRYSIIRSYHFKRKYYHWYRDLWCLSICGKPMHMQRHIWHLIILICNISLYFFLGCTLYYFFSIFFFYLSVFVFVLHYLFFARMYFCLSNEYCAFSCILYFDESNENTTNYISQYIPILNYIVEKTHTITPI